MGISKPYLLEVIDDYVEIERNVNRIIQTSGYKNTYIAQKLKLPTSTYYQKKKAKSFTPKELSQIVRMLDDDYERDMIELEIAKASLNDDDEDMDIKDFIAFAENSLKT